jgi:hypothetical protein
MKKLSLKFLPANIHRVLAACCAFAFVCLVWAHPAFTQVKVWEDTLQLPAYEEGSPDPNPPFDQFSSSTNYPYTLRDQLTNKRENHAWRAVYLENQYLKCSILPDLGGHIYTCIDKLTNQPMFYANPSIKKADIGYRGGWSAFGVEFNFPVSHNWVTASPVDYSFATNPDGSASVFVGNIDRVYGMQWQVEIVLRPASTVLQLKVTLSNRSDIRHRFYWWSNAGVQVWDDSKITYPMQFSASHGFTHIDTWPVDSTGTDESELRNQKGGPVSSFVYGSREPFMGIWHPKTNTGVVHYSEYEELPGKKIWSWGSDPDGLDWRKTLSDNNSAYMEVQGGLFRNQETYAFLEPRQSIHFNEYWMPVRGTGGFVRANLNAILNLHRESGAMQASLNVNRAFPGATVRIQRAGKTILSEKVDLTPEHVWTKSFASAPGADKYSVDLLGADGNLLLHQVEGEYDWTPAAEVKVGATNSYKMPVPEKRSEDDWVQLGQDEELYGARLSALNHYKEGLVRFPDSLSLRKAAGRVAADLLRYREAVDYLEAVESRQTWNSETAYYLGIAYDGLGQERDAAIAFAAARRLPEFRAAACVRLAELEAREGHLQIAAADLEEAVRSAPDDLRGAEELVAVLNALGRKGESRDLAHEWLLRYPTSYILREETGQRDNAHIGADVDRLLNAASEYMRLGFYQAALSLLARDYPATPTDQREPGEPPPAQHPMVAYYRGFCNAALGLSSAKDYALAAGLSTKYVFPSGALSLKVLQSAVRANEKDANALSLLGTLEFSVGLEDAGMEKWTRARELNPAIPALDANLGRAFLHLKAQPERALEAFRRGATTYDRENLGDYFGMDQTLSLLRHPAADRVAALALYPNLDEMPTDLVYEFALNLAEAGDFDRAEQLFRNRFFLRAEGGTNVRQVWVEVRLQHALKEASAGRCDAAREIAAHLGDSVPGLDFTRDGMEPTLDTPRNHYLLGELQAACGHPDLAAQEFKRAATAVHPDRTSWSFKAAGKLGEIDLKQWQGRLLSALPSEAGAGSSLQLYEAAMVRRELGDEEAAQEDLRQALLMHDNQMAYHLSRLAMEGRDR